MAMSSASSTQPPRVDVKVTLHSAMARDTLDAFILENPNFTQIPTLEKDQFSLELLNYLEVDSTDTMSSQSSHSR
eukprot:5879336-Amphidinium_carterae.1